MRLFRGALSGVAIVLLIAFSRSKGVTLWGNHVTLRSMQSGLVVHVRVDLIWEALWDRGHIRCLREDIFGKLKLAMEQGKLTLPRDNPQLLIQMTSQRCEPTASGTLKFSHPAGTHDDQLWSLALAVYASQQQIRPTFKPIARSF